MNYGLAACLLVASYDALLTLSVLNERFFGAHGWRGEEGLGIRTRLEENTEKRNAMFVCVFDLKCHEMNQLRK